MSDDDIDGQVSLAISGPVATVTIDRAAKLNAFRFEMLYELESALRSIRESDARVVIVRTGGDRVFSVGADIKQFATFGPAGMWRRWIGEGHRVFAQLAELPQPTIAAIDGLAAGGGLELALCCDFRIASDDATFTLPETALGTIPGWGGTERLTRIVGEARAKELILARRRIGADTAHQWGLVTGFYPRAELQAGISALVDELLGGARLAQQVSKQLIQAASANAPSAILEALASGFTAGATDFSEGVAAFMEKRQPRFTGN